MKCVFTPTAMRSCITLGNSSATASVWIFARAICAGDDPYSVSGPLPRLVEHLGVQRADRARVRLDVRAGLTGVVDAGSKPDSTNAAAVSISSFE